MFLLGYIWLIFLGKMRQLGNKLVHPITEPARWDLILLRLLKVEKKNAFKSVFPVST